MDVERMDVERMDVERMDVERMDVERIYVERMDEYRMAEGMAKLSGGRVRGRPRLGWMDGVKVALGNRGMTMGAARYQSGEPWYICN